MLRTKTVALTFVTILFASSMDPVNSQNQVGDKPASTGGKTRSAVRAMNGMVATSQPLASAAGLRILQQGGNAVDAAVAAAAALCVVEPMMVSPGGDMFAIVWDAKRKELKGLNASGRSPAAISIDELKRRGIDRMPSEGIHTVTVPGAVDGWAKILERYGTMKLAQVLQPAIEYADAFPIDEMRVNYIHNTRRVYEQWPASRAVFLPNGQEPKIGDIFVQKDLARTLRELLGVEKKNARRGRHAALEAVRDYFYRGPLAKRYCDAIEQAGGLMRASDMAKFRAEIDQPAKVVYRGYEVYKVGFWAQGPAMLETLNLLEGYDLKAMGHNSPDYIHTVTEAVKLAFADCDRWYGDPRFVKVPGAELLAKDYAELRRALIDPKSASTEQRPGDPVNKKSLAQMISVNSHDVPEAERASDTTCVNVIDAAGNVFSATPSGAWLPSFIAGSTGIPISSRMQSFLLTPGHPNELKPGKRPRITLSPTLVLKDGQPFAALSTPGGDNQDQALTQVLLNVIEFGMNPQEAVEAARFETAHFVSSFADHKFNPASLSLEKRFGEQAIEEMKKRGHKVDVNENFAPTSAPTIVIYDPKSRLIQAGADVRRGRYAVGW